MSRGLRTGARSLAAAAERLKQNAAVCAPFTLSFLTDADRIAAPEPVIRAMPEGAAVILRDYSMPRRGAYAARLRALCARYGLIFLVGADIALAKKVRANGVHLPSWALHEKSPDLAGLIVTAACHDEADLRLAAQRGADAVYISPVFPTQSHPSAGTLGPERLKALAGVSTPPVMALGGVDQTNAALLAHRNVVGFGAIGAFSR
ncbi:MAG: thiamine phosphate synthase [Pseudomonadota bacterium]